MDKREQAEFVSLIELKLVLDRNNIIINFNINNYYNG